MYHLSVTKHNDYKLGVGSCRSLQALNAKCKLVTDNASLKKTDGIFDKKGVSPDSDSFEIKPGDLFFRLPNDNDEMKIYRGAPWIDIVTLKTRFHGIANTLSAIDHKDFYDRLAKKVKTYSYNASQHL